MCASCPRSFCWRSPGAAPHGAGGGGGGQGDVSEPQPQAGHTAAGAAIKVAVAQDRHIALCDRLGGARCRVLEMRRSAADDGYAGGSLKLVVDARLARRFGQALAAAVGQGGGRLAESSIEAEDLSKQIVDTEARQRARQALAGMTRFFGESLGLLIQLIAVLLPWAAVGGIVLLAIRRLRARRRHED